MESRFNTLQTRLVEHSGNQWIEGYATVFETPYYVPQEGFTETINRNAFTGSIASGKPIESRYNHDRNHILGRTDLGTMQVWIDTQGVRYRVKFNVDDPDHLKVKAKLESGLIQGSSMTFLPKRHQFKAVGNTYVCEIIEADLYEAGPVNDPCNLAATAAVRDSSSKSHLSDEFQRFLKTQKLLQKLTMIK